MRRNLQRNEKKRKRKNRTRKQKKSLKKSLTVGGSNFTLCVETMKSFASRLKKAGNMKRQAERIESFMKINEAKMEKVEMLWLMTETESYCNV